MILIPKKELKIYLLNLIEVAIVNGSNSEIREIIEHSEFEDFLSRESSNRVVYLRNYYQK